MQNNRYVHKIYVWFMLTNDMYIKPMADLY